MRAVVYDRAGSLDGDGKLRDAIIERPQPRARDVIVKVNAVSVNPVDTKIRQRRNPGPETANVLGWDAVGEIVSLGDQASKFKVGQRVWYAGDISRSGTNAEYHGVDERIVGLAPDSLSDGEAAAMPLTTLTAYEMLFDRLRVKTATQSQTKTLLIIGAAGGVGSIAVQLGRALTDLIIVGTASRQETASWVKGLGAHHIVNHHEPLKPQFEAANLSSPDFVFSTTHSHLYFDQLAELMAPQSRFGLIDDPESFNIAPFKRKSISTHWEFMFTRSLFDTPDLAHQGEILNEVSRLIEAGKIKSTAVTDLGVINAANLSKAHKFIESGAAKGKVTLSGFGG